MFTDLILVKPMTDYQTGSLVRTRGREWVVLPESGDDWLILRPLGGTDREIAGVYLPLESEDVAPARFDLPDPNRPGDFRSCRLLRDAVRLGFRSSAGPFRSFARLNVEARPYQLVPLLMALKLDPVRLLIADDVGIGKTIEAGLVVRELLDRGEAQRLAVLCPPHLAEQWQRELRDKFHIEAELVLSSTVGRLERHTAVGQSLFDLYPYVIVSTDYIKSSRRRDDFVRTCPNLVVAHLRLLRRCSRPPSAPSTAAAVGCKERPPPDPGDRHAAQRGRRRLPLPPGPAQARVPDSAGRPDGNQQRAPPEARRCPSGAAPPRRRAGLHGRRHPFPQARGCGRDLLADRRLQGAV